MFLTTIARPRPGYNFSGLIGMWWVSETKVALKASKNHHKGEKYEVDCTMDVAWYLEKLTSEVYPAIRQAMWWLASENFTQIAAQHDGARAHTPTGITLRC